jgi:DNA-binding CsgD family transcriptional regulator
VGDRDPGDSFQGWRPGGQHYLHPYPTHVDVSKALANRWNARTPDPSFIITRKGEGSFRSIIHRRDLPPSWFKSDHYLLYHATRGIYDTCLICFPVNEDVESWFAFQRTRFRRRFSPADELVLLEALRPLRWFHRQLALAHGLALASSPVTPTQRRVLRLLLSDKSEKEIADQLGQSFHTTHEHVANIFAKFGVKGRSGLMALWLGSKT